VPLGASLVPDRLGLASGRGISVAVCDSGEGAVGPAKEATPTVEGGIGLWSGSGTLDTVVSVVPLATALAVVSVVATEGVAGLRSGVGVASPLGVVPVVAASAAGAEEASDGLDEAASGAPAAGAASDAALSGLRSGNPGAIASCFAGAARLRAAACLAELLGAACACLAAAECCVLASAVAGARHMTMSSNGKMCAKMRFISSIGYRLRSCYAVRTSPEPGSRDEDGSLLCLN
jgi:hypothetical protein